MERLPHEVLIEIFTYLDKNSIKCATAVCRRWHQVVTSSHILLRKLEAFIRVATIDAVAREFADIPVHSLMLHTYSPLDRDDHRAAFESKLATFLDRHRTTIEFTELVYANASFFADFATRLTNLRHLNLVSHRSHAPADFEPVDFPHLRTVGLKNSTHVLRSIRPRHVEVLKVIDGGGEHASANLTHFFRQHASLREVKFMGFIPTLRDVDAFEFRLTSLSVLLKGQPETDSSSILALMRAQRATLRDLKLLGFNTKDFVEFAVSEMAQLVRLEVDITRIRTELAAMRRNASIRTLMVQSIALNIGQMIRVVEACGAVESLRVVSNTNLRFGEWLQRAAHSMPRLRHLSIDSLLSILPPRSLNFRSLETLTVSKLGSDSQVHGWVQLASRCENLRSLVVTGFGLQLMQSAVNGDNAVADTTLCKNELLFLLVALPRLEQIELRGKFTLTDDIVEVLTSDRCRLRRFNFAADGDANLAEKLRRLNESRVQCQVLKTDDGKKPAKRKISEHYD